MPRIRAKVFVAQFILCLAPLLLTSHDSEIAVLAAATPLQVSDSSVDVQKADDLFERQKWSEARAHYDSIKASNSETKRHIASRTIVCSLNLEDWNDALQRAVRFKKTQKLKIWSAWPGYYYWPQRDPKLDKLLNYIAHLEVTRNLLVTIRGKYTSDKGDEFQNRLDEETISLNFEMLRVLDPDNIRPQEYGGWNSGYDSIDWWWEGVRSADDSDRRYYRYGKGVPANSENGPVFLSTPAQYNSELTRAKKILFLLKEIQGIDHTKSKKHTARTLLHRADLNRRLYGPIKDPAWRKAVFYYQYADRPTFGKSRNDASLKPLQKLEDNESRLIVRINLIEKSITVEIPSCGGCF
ncbi:MAG: hypothetical protein AAF939_07910 [Planctomycetota bacterium]